MVGHHEARSVDDKKQNASRELARSAPPGTGGTVTYLLACGQFELANVAFNLKRGLCVFSKTRMTKKMAIRRPRKPGRRLLASSCVTTSRIRGRRIQFGVRLFLFRAAGHDAAGPEDDKERNAD